jgi:CDP-glucose 4,6-dehydratase
MHFLVTGHTGFKGSYLLKLLLKRGHKVSGFSLDPEKDSIFALGDLESQLEFDFRGDIREFDTLKNAVEVSSPDFIIHLAAQSLVMKSYRYPLETFEVNVNGTLNVLAAAEVAKNLKGVLIVTTDKVYKNQLKVDGYVESDPLGGTDPYSASKAMADIATQSWVHSYKTVPICIARAGNVIGGGDVSEGRLIPDVIAGLILKEAPCLRNPHAVRPWQYVLDCLNGYLTLVDQMLSRDVDISWNFGPKPSEFKTVQKVVEEIFKNWDSPQNWIQSNTESFPEASYLTLDSTKARKHLNWTDRLSFEEGVEWTVNWHKNILNGSNHADQLEWAVNHFEQR